VNAASNNGSVHFTYDPVLENCRLSPPGTESQPRHWYSPYTVLVQP